MAKKKNCANIQKEKKQLVNYAICDKFKTLDDFRKSRSLDNNKIISLR